MTTLETKALEEVTKLLNQAINYGAEAATDLSSTKDAYVPVTYANDAMKEAAAWIDAMLGIPNPEEL